MSRALLVALLLVGGCPKPAPISVPEAPAAPPRILVQRAALPNNGEGSTRPDLIVGANALVLTQEYTAQLWARGGERPVMVAEHVSERIINAAALAPSGASAAIVTATGAVRFHADGREEVFPIDLSANRVRPVFVGDRLFVATMNVLHDPAAGREVALPVAAMGPARPTPTEEGLGEVAPREFAQVSSCGDHLALGYSDGSVDLWQGLERTKSLVSAGQAGLARSLQELSWSADCRTVQVLVRLPTPALLTWEVDGAPDQPKETALPDEVARQLGVQYFPRDTVQLAEDGRLRLKNTVWPRLGDGWGLPSRLLPEGENILDPVGSHATVTRDGSLHVDRGVVLGRPVWMGVAVNGADAAFYTTDAVQLLWPGGGQRVEVKDLRAIALAAGKLYTSDLTPSLRVWDVRTGLLESTFPLEQMAGALAVSPTTGIAAIAGHSSGFWMLEGPAIEQIDLGYSRISAARWSPDGSLLGIASDADKVWVIDMNARVVLDVGTLQTSIGELVWSPEGLIATGVDGPALLYPNGAKDGVWTELEWTGYRADISPGGELATIHAGSVWLNGAPSLQGVRASQIRWTGDGRLCWIGETAGCIDPHSGVGVRVVGDTAGTRVDQSGRVDGDADLVRVHPLPRTAYPTTP
ncbi:MAG: hypothetical protein V4850_04440 [Myxococcota bacterium]